MAKKPTMKNKKSAMMGKDKMPEMMGKDKMPAKANGLTAAQKKLPAGLQAAIMKKKKK